MLEPIRTILFLLINFFIIDLESSTQFLILKSVNFPEDLPWPLYSNNNKFIFDGKKILILNKKIKCNFKVELLHGIRDSSVHWAYSINLTKTLIAKKLKLTIIDDGDHSLSRVQDLKKLELAIKNII